MNTIIFRVLDRLGSRQRLMSEVLLLSRSAPAPERVAAPARGVERTLPEPAR
jgi:hypothetical protein